MANKNFYFYISGMLSLALFVFFISIIFFMMLSSSKVKSFALKKDNFISISLVDIPKPKKTSTKKKTAVVPIQQKVKTSVSKPKNLNIDELFNDVWTKKIAKKTVKKKKVNNQRLQNIQKQSKTIDNNQSVKNEVPVDNNIQNKDEKDMKTSTGDEVNEYNAKIEALVYSNFMPPPNSQGSLVWAVVEISAIGKVIDFRILKYSQNQMMNSECDKIKARLKSVLFPISPDNQTKILKIKIVSKE